MLAGLVLLRTSVIVGLVLLLSGAELPQFIGLALLRPLVLAGLVLLRDGVEHHRLAVLLPQRASTGGWRPYYDPWCSSA